MRCLGALLLMPIIGAFGLTVVLAKLFGEKGGGWRILGILYSLIIGGIVVVFSIAFFLDSPVWKWIGISAGVIITLLGIWTTLLTEKKGHT